MDLYINPHVVHIYEASPSYQIINELEVNSTPSFAQLKNTVSLKEEKDKMNASLQQNEYVILLHGIGHSSMNMAPIEKGLKKQGYQTLNITYPSLKHPIADLAQWLKKRLDQEEVWNKADKVHFVAHSMGGLVSGFYLQDYKDAIPADKMGRVVMLGTPHGGSEVANALKDVWLYKKAFGPAGQELTTHARQGDQINPWYDLGMVAGTKNWIYPLGQIYIKNDHDGSVSVESTQIDGMKDHLTIHELHGFMAWNKLIQNQIIYFLQEGHFKHEK